jgi:hypothetical protein
MLQICPPAIIYLIFSITQILIDTYNGLYNTAIIKVIVTIMVTLLLNILCEQGLGIVSWIIVFIPFILMTVIVSMLLYIFGLNTTTGTINSSCGNNSTSCGNDVTIDPSGNVVVYNPYYNPNVKPVYYQSPNIIVPNPETYPNTTSTTSTNTNTTVIYYPTGSSSPAYQSGP